MMISLVIWIQHKNMTDRRTDRRTDRQTDTGRQQRLHLALHHVVKTPHPHVHTHFSPI